MKIINYEIRRREKGKNEFYESGKSVYSHGKLCHFEILYSEYLQN